MRYDTKLSSVIIRQNDGSEKTIKATDLRKECQCASCIDEFTGQQILNKEKVE